MQKDYKELIRSAFQARKRAYTPYSRFQVGAALLAKNGTVYQGCNIENASYGGTVCAERTAAFKAVSEGHTHFEAIAIVGGKKDQPVNDYAFPCGICRQVLREFADPEKMTVLVATGVNDYREFLLSELLPESFGPSMLE